MTLSPIKDIMFAMPSFFPELYNYSLIGPFLLRIALGFAIAKSGYGKFFENKNNGSGAIVSKIIGAIMTASGVLLIVGLFVQPSAMASILAIISGLTPGLKKWGLVKISLGYRLVLLAVSLSLLFLGPGIFSLDLPL